MLAALILERAAGVPVENVIRNTLFEPLGLGNSLHGNEAAGVPGLTHGYVALEGELLDVFPWYARYGSVDAPIQASVDDLADFIHALFTASVLLDDTLRARLTTVSGLGSPPRTMPWD